MGLQPRLLASELGNLRATPRAFFTRQDFAISDGQGLIGRIMNLTNHCRRLDKLETTSCCLKPFKHPGNANSLTLDAKMASERHSLSRYDHRIIYRTSVDSLIEVAPIISVCPSSGADPKVTITTIMPASDLSRPIWWPRRPSSLQPIFRSHKTS